MSRWYLQVINSKINTLYVVHVVIIELFFGKNTFGNLGGRSLLNNEAV